MITAQVAVIGAGVVGLSVAARLAAAGRDVVVIEKHRTFGRETSSRNSEVIHAGIYYPKDSLKARLCIEGREMLYDYCAGRGVPHRRIGKLIVASGGQDVHALQGLLERGRENGVESLRLVDRDEVRKMEPAVIADAAVFSPDTGIVDSHVLMKKLYDEARAAGALFAFNHELDGIERRDGGYELSIAGYDERLVARTVVNCCGLWADRVAALAGIDPDAAGYRIQWVKGNYFSYGKPSPVTRLVYPLPHAGLAGLGTHGTLDLAGRLRFGPDVEPVTELGYDVDPGRVEAFCTGARNIISGIDCASLGPDMAGIRPKLIGQGVRDFVIADEASRGLPGFVNLVGIESPGLTSCLAIARHVGAMLQ